MLLFALVSLFACREPLEPEPDPTTPGDPLAEALGSCTRTGEEVDAELGPLAVLVHEYDEHGDVVHARADYADDESFYDWDILYTLGEPHQVLTAAVTYPGSDLGGWTTDYTWQDGHIVLEQTDYDADGTLDESGAYVYEPGTDKVIRWEWDYDGDGTLDDTADFAWTPQGAGWHVLGEGEDPNGPYQTEEERDDELREQTYHYEDSTGLAVDWEVTSWSALGMRGDYASVTRQDGEIALEESETVTFDEQGRTLTIVHDKVGYEDGQISGSFSRTTTFTYDCP
jgi:hypothetical protein